MEINPRVVFERMFGRAGHAGAASGAPAGGPQHPRLDRRRNRRAAAGRSGAQRSRRLGEYLDNVREIERRIQRTEARNGREVTTLDAPLGVPESYEEHVALMFDLLAVAYQADLTRVFTFMIGRELSNRTYTQLDLSEPHHAISHHANDPAKVAAHTKINTYHVGLFAKFIERLRSDAGRRRHAARSLADLLRRRHGRRERPLAVPDVGDCRRAAAAGRLKGDRHIVAGDAHADRELLAGRSRTSSNARSTDSARAPGGSSCERLKRRDE